MTMKKPLLLFLTFILGIIGIAPAQYDTATARIEVQRSARVDTSNEEVMNVVNLYEDYLNSRPDSVHNNPYWNSREKKEYEQFDFSAGPIYQGDKTPEQLFYSYMPFVLSVEQFGEKYRIRTLFVNEAKSPPHQGSKVWAIHKLSAVKENGDWVLENLLVDLKKQWKTREQGMIRYHFPPSLAFDETRAQKANEFCRSLIDRFNPGYEGEITYYLTSSIEKMGLIRNLEYGITLSKGMTGPGNSISSATGDEFYPHEFVHRLLPENPNRGYVIEEGLASFLGSKKKPQDYKEKKMAPMAKDLANGIEKISFETVVSQEVRWNGYQTAYPAGAAICEVVHGRKGDDGLKKLMEANSSDYEAILIALERITGLDEAAFKKAWRAVFEDYR